MYLPGVRRRLAGGHGLGSIAWQVGQSGPVHVCSRRPLVYGMAAVPSTDMTGEKDKETSDGEHRDLACSLPSSGTEMAEKKSRGG